MEHITTPDANGPVTEVGVADVVEALERRASVKGRDVAGELRAIASETPSLSSKERLLGKLAQRRKELASRAFPDSDE